MTNPTLESKEVTSEAPKQEKPTVLDLIEDRSHDTPADHLPNIAPATPTFSFSIQAKKKKS